jgi:hypothetical protein
LLAFHPVSGYGFPMTNDAHPADENSGLVEWTWQRRSKQGGTLTTRTLEGEPVEATFLAPRGGLQSVTGTVTRNDAGELVVESWADGVRSQTAVPRDANVMVKSRTNR